MTHKSIQPETQSNMQDEALHDAVQRFFCAPTAPVNTHEEWLLRQASQLMHREATVVSLWEQSQRPQANARREKNKKSWQHRQPQQTPSSEVSEKSIPQSTVTEKQSWGES